MPKSTKVPTTSNLVPLLASPKPPKQTLKMDMVIGKPVIEFPFAQVQAPDVNTSERMKEKYKMISTNLWALPRHVVAVMGS
jgi:hypothetical protein